MELGLNLSFAVKRWMKPEQLACMCKRDFQVSHVQFTWDLIDPWWPNEQRNQMALEYKQAFEKEGVMIDATFGGLAAYSFANLLAPHKTQRDIATTYFKRAVDLTSVMGATVMGSPVGGMNYDDARDKERRKELYQEMLGRIREIAEYGKEKGIEEIHIEATPLWTEFPHTADASVELMEKLSDTAIPVKLLVDWGHALYQPLLKEEADMTFWLTRCAPYVGSIHLQQTDGKWDRHWDFTKEGIVTPAYIKAAIEKSGLEHIIQYLEVVTIFEEEDDIVYQGMKQTMDYLHKEVFH